MTTPSNTTPALLTLAQAAEALQVSVPALRERIRRAPLIKMRGGVARDLGVALARKFGSSWRIQLTPSVVGP
jgi:hypothetical protein